MAGIFLLAVLVAGAVGILVGIRLTIERYERIRAQRQADEERLAEVEELYAAWAALRNRDRQPSA